MGTIKVGVREFREKLASYLLDAEQPLAITRHGDTVGYYIPARRKRTEAERAALQEAASRLQQALAAEGISEEEVIGDFKRWRRGDRKVSLHKGLVSEAELPRGRLIEWNSISKSSNWGTKHIQPKTSVKEEARAAV
jgi:PHD/YefM family antitoxin component YafN of YafNO toxin-antitoxin module